MQILDNPFSENSVFRQLISFTVGGFAALDGAAQSEWNMGSETKGCARRRIEPVPRLVRLAELIGSLVATGSQVSKSRQNSRPSMSLSISSRVL